MATKKLTDTAFEIDAFGGVGGVSPTVGQTGIVFKPLAALEAIPARNDLHDFAIAALQSVDWNAIGMGVDQAAKLCWSMAEAMIRNKP